MKLKCVEKRNKAVSDANNAYTSLISSINSKDLYIKHSDILNSTGLEETVKEAYEEEVKNKIIKFTPISYLDYIYTNDHFHDYAKHSFVAKYFQRKVDFIMFLIFLLFFLMIVGIFLLTKNIGITLLFGVLLLIALVFIIKIFFPGETYGKFYKRTMYSLIYGIVSGYNVSLKTGTSSTTDIREIEQYIDKKFTRANYSERKTFYNNSLSGEINNCKLINTTIKRVNDTVQKNQDDVFYGLNLTMTFKNNFNKLNNISINIRNDESLFSALTEDTINSIHQNDRDYEFNSEELNKALDCKISGLNLVGDTDDLMMEIHKIITPVFEEHLLFLKKRYGSFNITIRDNKINFNVNYKKTTYQKFKSGDLFNSTKEYKDTTEIVKFPVPTTKGTKDFMYYSLFPIMEQLFLIRFFETLMLNGLNPDEYNATNTEMLKTYQDANIILAEKKYSEFKEIYKHEIDDLYELSKGLR